MDVLEHGSGIPKSPIFQKNLEEISRKRYPFGDRTVADNQSKIISLLYTSLNAINFKCTYLNLNLIYQTTQT